MHLCHIFVFSVYVKIPFVIMILPCLVLIIWLFVILSSGLSIFFLMRSSTTWVIVLEFPLSLHSDSLKVPISHNSCFALLASLSFRALFKSLLMISGFKEVKMYMFIQYTYIICKTIIEGFVSVSNPLCTINSRWS